MSLGDVFQNFAWRIEAISPTAQAGIGPFRMVDPEIADVETLRHRSFALFWESSDEDAGPTDLYDRWAVHTFTLEVYYRAGDQGIPNSKAHTLILADRDDICRTLRDPDLWAGTSDAASSTEIGLKDRRRVGDELERDEDTYTYRATWECHVREVEG